AAQFGIRDDRGAGRWSRNAQAGGSRTGRAARTGIDGCRSAAGRLGNGKLQGNATAGDEAGPESGSEGGYLRQNVSGPCGFDRGSHGCGAESFAAGKRDGKLRESCSARPREDCAGPDSRTEGRAAARNERCRDRGDELSFTARHRKSRTTAAKGARGGGGQTSICATES